MIKAYVKQFKKPEGFLGHLAGKIMSRRNRERVDWVVPLLNIKPGENILEIGYGPGLAIEKIGGITENEKITGIDHSGVMLKQAVKRNASMIKDGRLSLYSGTLDDLEENELFDIVFSINVAIFWDDPVAELIKIYKRMKNNGRNYLAVQPRYAKTEAEVKKISSGFESQLIKAGFVIRNVEFSRMNPHGAFCIEAMKS